MTDCPQVTLLSVLMSTYADFQKSSPLGTYQLLWNQSVYRNSVQSMVLLTSKAIERHIKEHFFVVTALEQAHFKIFYCPQKNLFSPPDLKILIKFFLPFTLYVHGHTCQILSQKLGQFFRNEMLKFGILLDNKHQKSDKSRLWIDKCQGDKCQGDKCQGDKCQGDKCQGLNLPDKCERISEALASMCEKSKRYFETDSADLSFPYKPVLLA